MRIAVLGTGPVGQTAAAEPVDFGREGTVGMRSVEAAMHLSALNIEVVR